ncbi:roadblock/LC7 domain-containing protein [Flavobacterium sp. H122]|uniref:roadblock/LC7 domain-containing protein n=1 Tax=Flavobacterium sp. H122 TaxID=2529860 RepID=UPI0010AACE3D|nr:roadblock/LC7 domain-containing protein [Flavobacterium sp. H122]
MKKLDLDALINETGVDSALIFNGDGNLIKSLYLNFDGNIAAMGGILLTMCKELIEDLKLGNSQELILQAEKGLFFVRKLEKDEYLALITKNPSKLGLIHLKLQAIS